MRPTHPRSRKGLRLTFLTAFAVLLLSALLLPVHAAQAKSATYAQFNIDLNVLGNGTFHVEETQVVDFVDGPFSQGHRSIPLAHTEGITNIAVYEIVNGQRVPYTKANTADTSDTYSVATSSTEVTVKWAFDSTTNRSRTFVVAYDMLGALRSYPGSDPPNQQVWFTPVDNALTDATPVESSTFTIHLPNAADPASIVLAENGKQITDLSAITSDNQTFSFSHGAFNGGDDWEIRLQTNVVAPNAPVPAWQASDDAQRQKQESQSQRDTQIAGFASLGGIAALIIGSLGILMLWYTSGKDPSPGVVASFLPEPPDDTPPAVVGVLIDEKADERDIVSTIVDLGNRGVLVVHDEPNSASPSLELTGKAVALSPFEQRFIATIFPGDTKVISYSGARIAIENSHAALKTALYEEVVNRGYFDRSPEQTRGRWRNIAMVITSAAVLAGLLGSIFISSWLVVPAMAVAAVALILRQVARTMPKRTEKGAEAAGKWRAFRRYLDDLDKYDNVETAKANFNRFLPYAIAFGIEKGWVKRFERAGAYSPSWLNPAEVGDVVGIPGGHRGGSWNRPVIIAGDPWPHGGSGSGSGGSGLPDVDMPDVKMPDLQKASDSAARGLSSASKGGVDLLNVLGAIIQIASIFAGGGDKGGSSGGGSGGFN